MTEKESIKYLGIMLDSNLNWKKTEKESIKYLGIILDSNLNWKKQVQSISTKIYILSILCYCVNLDILINLYYSLIYPFLIYGLVVWGSTYPTNINPLLILQKLALRIMTFSKFGEHYIFQIVQY